MDTPTQNISGANKGSPPSHRGTRGDSPRPRTGDENLKNKAGALAGEAEAEARANVDEARSTAAGKVDTLADSAKAAAAELKGDDMGHLSDYVSELAQNLGQLSTNMREKTGDDLLHEVSRLARDNPALFVTGSIAIGFGLSRFAKASTPSRESTSDSGRDSSLGRRHSASNPATQGSVGSGYSAATGSGTTPPYGAQPATRMSTPSSNGSNPSSQPQTGVRS
ncbi:hypothetical protein [Lysobacter sp. A3-1-A15]|uniref:hypothetical protein n=1 Tax=Novilysobacter viscosus TaxID=3098602 RepID=UPI002ED863D9